MDVGSVVSMCLMRRRNGDRSNTLLRMRYVRCLVCVRFGRRGRADVVLRLGLFRSQRGRHVGSRMSNQEDIAAVSFIPPNSQLATSILESLTLSVDSVPHLFPFES